MILRPESLIILANIRVNDVQKTAFWNSLLGLGLLGAFEPDYERNSEREFLSSFNNTLGDVVASHDTCERVKGYKYADGNQDAPPKMLMKMLLTLGSDKRISNAFLTVSGVAPLRVRKHLNTDYRDLKDLNSPSTVQEVGGVPTMEGKDIHCRHGQTGTVHETPNVPIQLDKVQVGFLGLNFGGFLLRDVPEIENILLTEFRVVVKPELGIHAAALCEYRRI